jgi:hypothetical protein
MVRPSSAAGAATVPGATLVAMSVAASERGPGERGSLAQGRDERGEPAIEEPNGKDAACDVGNAGRWEAPRGLVERESTRALTVLAAAYRSEFELARRFAAITEGEMVSPEEVDRAIDGRRYAEARLEEWSV